ncbi:imidazole glycerol phosphate synthase subunit HisH [Flavobacterium suzhouense]|uniref:Imidazole glycerol phosphate synthase subunit HisH n=1 Tax=Flavobacterium suzhouense TaxID=1529638 RepID=A0ABW5NR79_9FLAO
MKIAIVDYGMGNIRSIVSTLKYIGVEDVVLSSDFDTLNCADKIILPGVGSFGKAITQIREKNIDKYLNEIVVDNKKPLLGICLGMQLLGMSSTEDGNNDGLGYVDGRVEKFDNSLVKVPHVGFNQVKINNSLKMFEGFTEEPADFYFTHSYRMTSNADINQCYCNYQDDFVASFEFGNIAGAQFHPELSQTNGLRLLKNFIDKF